MKNQLVKDSINQLSVNRLGHDTHEYVGLSLFKRQSDILLYVK